MASEGRDRSDRWLQSPVWWIGSVAILGLVIVGVFGIRSLTASNEGTAPPAPAEERAAVESDETPVDGADGASAGDRPDEGTSDLLTPPEEPTESSNSASPQPEVAGEQPALVTTTPESSDADLVEADKFDVGRPVIGDPWSRGTRSDGWIVPWGDGFLDVGWPKISEDPYGKSIYDESLLMARTLSDSQHCRSIRPLSRVARIHNCWENLETSLVPNEGKSIRAIISDGERFIAASETDERVYVSVTSDLVNWDTIEIVLAHPPSLPDFVYTISYIDHLAIGPNGWLLKITTEFSIDVLVRAGIKEPRTGVSILDLREELADIFAYEEGVNVMWWVDEEKSDFMEQLFTWEELGFDKVMFNKYYSPQMSKPYIFSYNIAGSVWAASWGEKLIRVDLPDMSDLPDISGTCCSIIGTQAGYIAFSDPGEPGYDPTWWGPGVAFFSPDGYIWAPTNSPPAVLFNVWTVENGAVVSGALLEAYEENGRMEWGIWDWNRPLFWWFVNPDGSNWQEIEPLPYLRMRSPFEMLGRDNPTIRLAGGDEVTDKDYSTVGDTASNRQSD